MSRGLALALVLAFALGTPAAADEASTAPPLRWLAGDLHVHTRRSPDASGARADVVAEARAAGLGFVCLTDHGTTAARDDLAGAPSSPAAIVGAEWTSFAHALLLGGAREPPPPCGPAGAQAALDAARAAGAVVVLAHPCEARFPWLADVRGADGVEVWNGSFAIGNAGLRVLSAAALARAAGAAGATPSAVIEAASRAPGSGNDQAIAYWEALLERGERVAATGGSDRHGWPGLPVGTPATWVLAASAREVDVLAALRAHRTVVTASARAPFVELDADGDGDGIFETRIGDALRAGRRASVRLRVRGAPAGSVVQLVRRGRILAEDRVEGEGAGERTFIHPLEPAAGDWLRADLYLPARGLAGALDASWRYPGYARAAITSAIYCE